MLGQVTPTQFYNPTGTFVPPGGYGAPGYGAPAPYGSPYGSPYGTYPGSYTTQGSFFATVDPVLILGLGAVAAFLLLRKK